MSFMITQKPTRQDQRRISGSRVMCFRRNKVHSLKNQAGMGVFSVLGIVAIAVFLGLFAIKVGPNYLENWTVTKIANDVVAQPDLLRQPKSKVYSYLNQAYRTNSLWDLKAEDSIKLVKDNAKGYLVKVQYEKREPLFHNIYVVTSFDEDISAVQ